MVNDGGKDLNHLPNCDGIHFCPVRRGVRQLAEQLCDRDLTQLLRPW